MHRRGARVAVAFALVWAFVAGCGGGDGQDEVGASAGGSSSSLGTGTTSTVATALADVPPTSGPAARQPAPPAAGSGSPSGRSAPAAAPADPVPSPVVAGTYTYAVTGSARTSAGTVDVPPEYRLTVDTADGADQRQVRESSQGTQEQVLRYAADGVRVVRQKVSGRQGSKEFRPSPPVLTVPHPVAVGQRWAWEMRSTDGLTTVKGDFAALRREDVAVGGETVVTWVLRAHVTSSGDVVSTIASTIWYSPRYRLAVQTHAQARGSFGGMQFQSDTTEKLVSVTPS